MDNFCLHRGKILFMKFENVPINTMPTRLLQPFLHTTDTSKLILILIEMSGTMPSVK